jgi:hypothetical protein
VLLEVFTINDTQYSMESFVGEHCVVCFGGVAFLLLDVNQVREKYGA